MTECPWCYEEYDLTPETERLHLSVCKVFNGLPSVLGPHGKQYVLVPGTTDVYCERTTGS